MVLKCIIFVISAFFLATSARPEPPYNYPVPFLRQAPSAQTLGVSTRQNIGQSASRTQNYNNVATNFNSAQRNYVPPSTSYGTPDLRNANSGFSQATSSASQQSYSGGSSQPSRSYGTPDLRNANSGFSQATSSGSQQSYSGGSSQPSRSYGSPDVISSNQAPRNTYIPQSGPANIQKHIYVHVAPQEPEEAPKQRAQQQQAPAQKHYKIVFIKTPSYNPPAQYIAQQQAKQEEKTLIYVLVKKPEEAPEIVAPQVAPAPINKPEVYFIKYKTKSEDSQFVGGQNEQQVENLQQDNESVVIESAAGRGASSSGTAYNQGYNYDRPAAALN